MPYRRVLQPAVGIIPGNSRYLTDIKLRLFIIRSETDTYRRFTAKADLVVRGGRGGWRMPAILTDFLLFSCVTAFVLGIVEPTQLTWLCSDGI
jgi:hypothetical protein